MFTDLLMKRRSIRKFIDKKIEPEKEEALIKAALLSPASRNFNPWEFVVVKDRVMLDKLASSKKGAAFLEGAALAIVVIADTAKSDVWIEDCSIASALLLLAAEDLGLGACWAQIRKRKYSEEQSACAYVKELLKIEEDSYHVESIIGFGYADEERAPHDEGELQRDKVHYECFGSK